MFGWESLYHQEVTLPLRANDWGVIYPEESLISLTLALYSLIKKGAHKGREGL